MNYLNTSYLFNNEEKKINKRNFVISEKIRLNKDLNQVKYNQIKELFENPNSYLKEEVENYIVIGKKSIKDSFNIKFLATNNNPQTLNINRRQSLKKSSSKTIKNNNIDVNQLKLSRNSKLVKESKEKDYKDKSGDIDTYSFSNTNKNAQIYPKITSSTKFFKNISTNNKDLKVYIDNSAIHEISNKFEKEMKENVKKDIENIFNKASNDCKQAGRSGYLNKKEIDKCYNLQEENILTNQNINENDDTISKYISIKCKRNEKELLFNKSKYNIFLLKGSLSNSNFQNFDSNGLKWKLDLRDGDRTYSKVNTKSDINSIYSTVMNKRFIEKEIVSKPDDFQMKDNEKSIRKKEEGYSIINNRNNAYLQTSTSNNNNFIRNPSFSSSIMTSNVSKTVKKAYSQKNIIISHSDINFLTIKGVKLIDIEKEIAISIKGKKYLYRNIEKDYKKEEVFAIKYEDIFRSY